MLLIVIIILTIIIILMIMIIVEIIKLTMKSIIMRRIMKSMSEQVRRITIFLVQEILMKIMDHQPSILSMSCLLIMGLIEMKTNQIALNLYWGHLLLLLLLLLPLLQVRMVVIIALVRITQLKQPLISSYVQIHLL